MAYAPLYDKQDFENLIRHIKFMTGELSLEELYGKPLEKVQEEAARVHYTPATAEVRRTSPLKSIGRGLGSATLGFPVGVGEFLTRFGARKDELIAKGITEAAAFLPGAAVGLVSPKKGREVYDEIKSFMEKHLLKPVYETTRMQREAYRTAIEEPVRKLAPSETGYEIGHELGEWTIPTAAASAVAGALGLAAEAPEVAQATRLGVRILKGAPRFVVRNALEATTAKTIAEVGLPREERGSLPREIFWWGTTNLLFKGLGVLYRAARRVVRREVPSDDVLKRVLEREQIEVEKSYPEPGIEPPTAEAKVEAPTPPRPERHAEPPPSTGVVQRPKPKPERRTLTLGERIAKLSGERRYIALATIEDYIDSPELTQEAQDALRLWRTYKGNPAALDDASRTLAAQLDARLGHPAGEIAFIRAYKDEVRSAVLRGSRKLPETHVWVLDAALRAPREEFRKLLKSVKEAETKSAKEQAQAEAALRRLVERQRAAQRAALAEIQARGAVEPTVEHMEAPPRQWPVLEEAEAVPEAPRTVEVPRTAEEARRSLQELATRKPEAVEAKAKPVPEQKRTRKRAETAKKPTEFFPGDIVLDNKGRRWRVVDTSDPSVLEVVNEQGVRAKLGRKAAVKVAEGAPAEGAEGATVERRKAAETAAGEVSMQKGIPPQARAEVDLVEEWNRVRRGETPVENTHPALRRLKEEYDELRQQLTDLKTRQEEEVNKTVQNIQREMNDVLERAERKARQKGMKAASAEEREKIVAKYRTARSKALSELSRRHLKARVELEAQIRRYETDPEFVKQRLGEAYHEMKKSGEVVELHSGLHPEAVKGSLKRMFGSRNAGTTFTPVEQVDGVNVRSLSQTDFEKLPDDIIMIDGQEKSLKRWLEELDTKIGRLNQRRHELELQYGAPQFMPPEARQVYDAIGEELKKLAEKRELLRVPVEDALDLARRGQYAKSLAMKINNARLLPEGARVIRIGGEPIFYEWEAPSGKKLLLPLIEEFTVGDEDILRTSATIMKNYYIGLPRDMFSEPVVRAFRNATYMMYHFISDYETRLYKILKPVIKDRSALERITLLLEGKDVPRATEVERKVAADLRRWYDDLFQEFGIDPERYLKDYAPRIRQAGSIWKAFDGKPPRELVFFAELERQVPVPVFPRELNALTAGLAYVRRGAQKKFLEPVLENVRPIVMGRMSSDKQKLFEEYINTILGRPLSDERLIQNIIESTAKAVYGQVPSWARKRFANAVSQYITHLGYLGTIGGNPMSVLKNTLQATVPVWVLDKNFVTGLKYFQKARRALFTKEGRALLDYCWVHTMREEVFLENLERRLSLITGAPEVGKALRLLEDVGFKLYGKAERLNVSISYMMKLLYDLERGKPLAEAIRAANKFAADTQFLYGIDSPIFWKGPTGRLFGMLMSYPLNYVRMFAEMKRTDPDWAIKSLNAVIGGTVLVVALSKLTGLDFYTETPFATFSEWWPVRTARGLTTGEIAEEVSLPAQMLFKSGKAVVAGARLLGEGYGLSTATEEDRQAILDFLGTTANFIPFYTAGRRVYRFWRAAQNGWEVADSLGRLKYRYGEVEVPGEGVRTGYHPIPEQVRALVGPTVEQHERGAIFEQIRQAEGEQRRLRNEAFQAWLEGDVQRFLQLQSQLVAKGFNPLKMQDIERRLQEAEKPAVERAAEGLPSGYILEEPPAQRLLRQLLGTR